MNTVKAQILGDPSLQTNFDRCVNLFKSFLEQVSNDRTQTFNVSRVGTQEGNRGGKANKKGKWVKLKNKNKRKREGDEDGDNKGEITDRYYKSPRSMPN